MVFFEEMPLTSSFELETVGSQPQISTIMPGDFVFKTSYTDFGPEVIVFKCHPSDKYGELYIVEGVEAEPEDKPLVETLLGSDSLVTKLEPDPEDPEAWRYIIVDKQNVVGWLAINHLLIGGSYHNTNTAPPRLI